MKPPALKIIVTAVLLAVIQPSSASASGISCSCGNKAISGYDPVGYFNEGRSIKGSGLFQASHNDANWRFTSEDNLKAFKQSPEKYIPQYGGYCAWKSTEGITSKANPTIWKMINGRLYFFSSTASRSKWEKDLDKHLRHAAAHSNKLPARKN